MDLTWGGAWGAPPQKTLLVLLWVQFSKMSEKDNSAIYYLGIKKEFFSLNQDEDPIIKCIL